VARNPEFSRSINAWVRAHPIGAFCVWFFPVAWAIALLPLVVPRPIGIEVPLEVFLSGATLLGGLLPVVVITRLVDGPAGLDAFRRRLRPPRASLGWYTLALFPVPLLSVLLAVIIYGPPNVTAATPLSALVNGLFLQTLLGFLAVNLWEEATWMGFVQARLQAQRGIWPAAVVTAVLFALQHLPLFVEGGLTNAAGLIVFAAFIVIAIPFRALVAWMYHRTGSLFLVGLLHAVGDATTNGSFAAGFLPRLYDNADGIGFLHMLALALMGVVVIAATRARLGVPARPALRAEAGAAPATA
jgi:membrane protease YdiL (CAAX protease family)